MHILTKLFVLIHLYNFASSEFFPLHFADFLEFHTSLLHCKNAQSVIQQQQVLYQNCTQKYDRPNHPGVKTSPQNDYANSYLDACQNSPKEKIKCWEPIIQKAKECNARNGKGYPTSFIAVQKAICKDDFGRSFAGKLNDAMAESQKLDKDAICSSTGEHWIIACKDLMNGMTSTDTCRRHSALNKCSKKIICPEIPLGRLFLDVYKEAGKIQGCDKNQVRKRKRWMWH